MVDCFFDQELVKKLRFVNPHFIWDQWRLLDLGLVKIFGKSGYELLEGYLVKLVKSNSEEEFQSIMDLAFQRLYSQVPRNGVLESKIAFVEKRCSYGSYLLAQIPWNHGLQSDACSKQNNWSVISHINPGVTKGGNTNSEHLVALIKDLLKCQKAWVATTNQLLEGMCQMMPVEMGRLRTLPQTCLVQDLLKAATLYLQIY